MSAKLSMKHTQFHTILTNPFPIQHENNYRNETRDVLLHVYVHTHAHLYIAPTPVYTHSHMHVHTHMHTCTDTLSLLQ